MKGRGGGLRLGGCGQGLGRVGRFGWRTYCRIGTVVRLCEGRVTLAGSSWTVKVIGEVGIEFVGAIGGAAVARMLSLDMSTMYAM